MNDPNNDPSKEEDFLQAAKGKERGIVAEFIDFMAENKVWWMVPILIVFLLVGTLIALGSSAVAPFIYAMW